MKPLTIALTAVASIAGIALMLNSSAKAKDAASTEQLSLQSQLAADMSLPYRVRRWAEPVAMAAQKTCPKGMDLYKWAIALMWIMDHETGGGDGLTPKGPGGTGDHGHGRGLMQLDDRTWGPDEDGVGVGTGNGVGWLANNDWRDPTVNIQKAGEILRDNYKIFAKKDWGYPTLYLAVDSYNSGSKAVKDEIAAGNDPDAASTDGQYGSGIYDHVYGAEA